MSRDYRSLDRGESFVSVFDSLLNELLDDVDNDKAKVKPKRYRNKFIFPYTAKKKAESIRNPFAKNNDENKTIEDRFITVEKARELTKKKRDELVAEQEEKKRIEIMNNVLIQAAELLENTAANDTNGTISIDLTKIPEFETIKSSAFRVRILNTLSNILRSKGFSIRFPSKDKEVIIVNW